MDLHSILTNPIWAVIATIATVIAIFITIGQQQRKGISYKVISDTQLLSLKEEVKGRVQVFFDTKPVGNARLVVLKILNSGNVPILPGDYHEHIKLGFGDNAEILDAEVLETFPDEMKDKAKALLKADIRSITLEPLLLNSKDSITLKVLLTQTHLTREIKATARIAGINQILNADKFPPNFVPLARTFTYFSYFIFLMAIIYLQVSKYEHVFIESLVSVLIIIFFALFYVPIYWIIASIGRSFIYKENLFTSIKYLFETLLELIKFMIYGSDKNLN